MEPVIHICIVPGGIGVADAVVNLSEALLEGIRKAFQMSDGIGNCGAAVGMNGNRAFFRHFTKTVFAADGQLVADLAVPLG